MVDEMVGWHHKLNGYEFEQTPGDSEGQESLACCSLWGRKESDVTQQLKQQLSFSNSFSHLHYYRILSPCAIQWVLFDYLFYM